MGGGGLDSRADLKKSANLLNRCNVQKKKKKEKRPTAWTYRRTSRLSQPQKTRANFSRGFPAHLPPMNTKTATGHRPASTRLKADS